MDVVSSDRRAELNQRLETWKFSIQRQRKAIRKRDKQTDRQHNFKNGYLRKFLKTLS